MTYQTIYDNLTQQGGKDELRDRPDKGSLKGPAL